MPHWSRPNAAAYGNRIATFGRGGPGHKLHQSSTVPIRFPPSPPVTNHPTGTLGCCGESSGPTVTDKRDLLGFAEVLCFAAAASTYSANRYWKLSARYQGVIRNVLRDPRKRTVRSRPIANIHAIAITSAATKATAKPTANQIAGSRQVAKGS